MTARATGHYTAEWLIAIEDNHIALKTLVTAFLSGVKPDEDTAWEYVIKAGQIRRDAGL